MQEDKLFGRTWERVGVSYGLDNRGYADFSPSAPCVEQLYVKKTDSEARTIMIDGWQGYATQGRLIITKRQARDLIKLLIDATED